MGCSTRLYNSDYITVHAFYFYLALMWHKSYMLVELHSETSAL